MSCKIERPPRPTSSGISSTSSKAYIGGRRRAAAQSQLPPVLLRIMFASCMPRRYRGQVGTEKKLVNERGDAIENHEQSRTRYSHTMKTSSQVQHKRPSYETVFQWSQSFDNLMKNKIGQKFFAEFLKGEFSDENILFWQACQELKREKNTEKIEEKARIIYEDFISILSPKEVSLDSRVREIVNQNMQKPTSTTFDEAQGQIYTLMQRDSYPRFLASAIYKSMMKENGVLEEVP